MEFAGMQPIIAETATATQGRHGAKQTDATLAVPANAPATIGKPAITMTLSVAQETPILANTTAIPTVLGHNAVPVCILAANS